MGRLEAATEALYMRQKPPRSSKVSQQVGDLLPDVLVIGSSFFGKEQIVSVPSLLVVFVVNIDLHRLRAMNMRVENKTVSKLPS